MATCPMEVNKRMRTTEKIYINLMRAVDFINVNMQTASRIEKQNKEILERLEIVENALLSVHDHMNDCAKFKVSEEKSASELMQEGIDNILGYQWPKKKGGNG